ncbi:hypothetical protein HYPSUDRAFT_70431 [Hypholoma sublateritium FD-334 SS-4]|uniref:Uncharacterized protein n=1 Tax=Hypholoma sublateritium (strain FD-334 SS-4) TaxID=945553 RepID=A0A0D2M3P1_HYPSF|nr:hypothetical protein HYPSUDRAFT_70431 [Hypholoma sublateritium FD-334 SS-4]
MGIQHAKNAVDGDDSGHAQRTGHAHRPSTSDDGQHRPTTARRSRAQHCTHSTFTASPHTPAANRRIHSPSLAIQAHIPTHATGAPSRSHLLAATPHLGTGGGAQQTPDGQISPSSIVRILDSDSK